jgi:signal transduction histidine kinase
VVLSTPELARVRLLNVAQARQAAREGLRLAETASPAGPARVQARPFGTGTGRVAIAVAESLARRDGALARLRDLLSIVGPLALLLATWAGYQVAGRALRPVEQMRRRAQGITEHDTAERLPVPATRDEIEALGRTLNDLLERLDGALRRERRMLADASHDLRTPLTLLRAEVQLALRGPRARSSFAALGMLPSSPTRTARRRRSTTWSRTRSPTGAGMSSSPRARWMGGSSYT